MSDISDVGSPIFWYDARVNLYEETGYYRVITCGARYKNVLGDVI